MAIEKEPIRRKNLGFTVRTITPAVFLTGEYNSRPEAKAAELTKLINGLLANGVWSSKEDAFYSGIPAGTFILVDDPKTPEKDFNVEIVPFIKRKKKEEAL